MLGGLFVRRYFFAPEGLETKKDDAIMHGLLFMILITGFLIEGARIAVTELGTPLSLLVAGWFAGGAWYLRHGGRRVAGPAQSNLVVSSSSGYEFFYLDSVNQI